MATITRYTCATIDGDFLDIREANNGELLELIFCEDGSGQETALLDLHIDDAVKFGKYLCSLEKKSKSWDYKSNLSMSEFNAIQ